MKQLLFLAACALAGAAASQDTDISRPVSRQTGIRAVVESSARWFPQIQPSFTIGSPSPANPSPPQPPVYVENTLPVGDVNETLMRGRPGPKFPGISATGWSPADPNIAVGPSHIVEVVNTDIAWFDKATGAKQFQVNMQPIAGPAEGFFESLGTTQFIFDPKCFYDQFSNRFFVVALELDSATTVSKLCIAVSDDNNPNGTWYKYRVEAKVNVNGNDAWLDYPGYGYNKDAIVITGNMFGFAGGFFGAQAIVMPKAPLLSGSAASSSSFMVGGASVQVAHTHDANLDRIYMVSQAGNTASLRVLAVMNPGASPTIQSTTVAVPSFNWPAYYSESVGGHYLDPLDGRMLEADWRGGSLVLCHTVRVSSSDPHNMVRWYEIRTNNFPSSAPTLRQSGNIRSTGGEDFFMPGIGINALGDIAVVFTRSSTTIVADMMMAGRRSGDPLGQMAAPIRLISSAGSTYGGAGGNRWGDYFATEIDPTDDSTFWSVAMIGQSNGGWITEIQSVSISSIVPIPVPYPPVTLAIYSAQGQNLVGGPNEIATSNNVYASLGSVLAPGLGQIAAVETSFQLNPSVYTIKSIKLKTESNSSTQVTGMVWLYDFVAGKYVQLKPFTILPGGDRVFEVPATGTLTRFVGPNLQVKAVMRALKPLRTGNAPFTFKIDQLLLSVTY